MEEALASIGVGLPDVALVDIGLPGMSGIEGTRRLREQHPKLLVMMLTVYGDDERIFEAMCAGARGYLLKKTPPARLLESLREVVTGGAPMSPEVARKVVQLFQKFHLPEAADHHLSATEMRLLKLLAKDITIRPPPRTCKSASTRCRITCGPSIKSYSYIPNPRPLPKLYATG
jgi:DNA-binding NarL/FixJ family response regulator